MVWLKSCPRCEKGDLHLTADVYGKFVECLQCGFMRDLPVIRRTKTAGLVGRVATSAPHQAKPQVAA